MMIRGKGNNSISRRTFLQNATFVTGALAAIPAVGTAKNRKERELADFKKQIETADQIAQKQGPGARNEYLNSQGIETKQIRGGLPNTNPKYQKKKEKYRKNNGAKSQKVGCISPTNCNGDIDVTLSLASDGSRYNLSSTMRMRYYYNCTPTICGVSNGGAAPPDGTSFMWPKGHLKVTNRKRIQDSVHSGPHQWWGNGSWNRQGLVMRTNDKKLCAEDKHDGPHSGEQWSHYETCGVFLEPASGFTGNESLHAKYSHSWNAGKISISVAYPWGVSISTGGTNAKAKTFQTTLDGQNLLVNI